MSKRALILWIVFLTYLSGCGERRVVENKKQEELYAPFIFKLQHLFDQGEYNPSFPVWFDDSIIRHSGVRKIKRQAFIPSSEGDSSVFDINSEYIYDFDISGKIQTYTLNSYYDNILFSSVTFNYTDVNEENGFALFTKNTEPARAPSELTSHIAEYIFIENDERYSIFKEKSSGYYLMFMKERAFWGAISVDTILHPSVADWVVLGTPKLPVKKFQVENTVKHSNVTEYLYGPKGKAIMKIVEEKYPFIQSRSVLYSESGKCTGFIDSIFTDEKFLSRKVYLFKLNEKGFPIELDRKTSENSLDDKILQKETFEYEFY